MNKVHNAKQLPKVYYGLHMAPGVAEYRPAGKDPYRILIQEDAIKAMDSTFPGRPVYVEHVDDVNLERLQEQADGYVVESFFNPADGKHWAKFLAVSDMAHEAIALGWKLSNAYYLKSDTGVGGQWHGVDYLKEVTAGEYEHLAIVSNPRYAESIILTPEQFKAYNEKKLEELKKLSNSKEKTETKKKETLAMKFNFFKREKIENGADLENSMVELGKDKKQMTVMAGLELAEKYLNMQGYASGDHMVKANDDEEMSVSELTEKYNSMKKKMNEDEEAMKKKNSEPSEEEKKKNAEEEEKKKKENEKKDEEEKNKNSSEFDKLKNAASTATAHTVVAELMGTQLERGKNLYGSK